MKITKFSQSCLLVETKGIRILIDPGSIGYENTFPGKEWADVDMILVTHKHGDHCNPDAIKEIMKNQKTKLYTTSEVSYAFPGLKAEIIKQGDEIKIPLDEGEIIIEVTKAVHGYIPLLKDGKEINENVGYIIDDGDKRLYQTSDTISFKNDYKCDIIFLPVVNHGLVMGPWDAALFAKETGAEKVVPIHYDNPTHPGDIEEVKMEFGNHGLNYEIMEIGDSIEI